MKYIKLTTARPEVLVVLEGSGSYSASGTVSAAVQVHPESGYETPLSDKNIPPCYSVRFTMTAGTVAYVAITELHEPH